MSKRILAVALVLALASMWALASAPLSSGLIAGPAPLPGPSRATVAPEAARVVAEAAASSYLQSHVGELGLWNPDSALALIGTETDAYGASHVRYQQTYKGVPVVGAEAIVHVNDEVAGVFAVTDAAQVLPSMEVAPSFGPNRAGRIARTASPLALDSALPKTDTRLVVYPDCAGYHLAYEVKLSAIDRPEGEPVETVTYLDARDGSILFSYDNLHTKGKPGGGGTVSYTLAATGTGKTLYSGSIALGTAQASDGSSNFAMKDLVRSPMYTSDLNTRTSGTGTMFTATSNTWGDGTNVNRATAGADAHYGAEMTYDFYKNTFGRSGIDGANMSTYSRVHYGRNYNNAFWSDSCGCMTYGDGDGRVLSPLVSLDVAGHEMSHGVTSRTSKLTYSGESGGLNESFSDIMGTGVEYYASTHGASKAWNYWIGEDVYTPGTKNDALRYMDDPTKDGASIDNYSKYTSNLDVHYSSGIWNNFFYLLAHGGTNRTSGVPVTGIGIDKALAVCYQANTHYFVSSTNFAGARTGCLGAAQQLYGASSTEYAAVAQAWTAVGVN